MRVAGLIPGMIVSGILSPTQDFSAVNIIPITIVTIVTVSREGFSGRHPVVPGSGRWPSVCLTEFSSPTLPQPALLLSHPQGSQRQEELEAELLFWAVHFAAWQLALGRDLAWGII